MAGWVTTRSSVMPVTIRSAVTTVMIFSWVLPETTRFSAERAVIGWLGRMVWTTSMRAATTILCLA